MRGALPVNIANALKRTPPLSASEEQELFTKVREGDRRAKERLILSQLRFVISIAGRYRRHHGCSLADLIQEGTVGLLEAIKRFNPERGGRLSTYAMWWIRAAIQDYVIRSSAAARIATTPRHRSMFFSRELTEGDGLTAEVARRLADRFNTTVDDVRAFAGRLRQQDPSLDDTAGPGFHAAQNLRTDMPDPESALTTKHERLEVLDRLRAAIPGLTRRERHILRRRFLSEKAESLAKIGRDLGLSKERVRQLEARALEKMQGRPMHMGQMLARGS